MEEQCPDCNCETDFGRCQECEEVLADIDRDDADLKDEE
jgi:hypothetical protein